MPLKSSPVSYAARLHRIHAAPQATRVEFSALGGMTWRGEGGDPAAKQAVAFRLALCWNVLEGIPSADLEAGMLVRLCDAISAGNLTEAQAIVARWGESVVLENGRAHDCQHCLRQSPLEPSAEEMEDQGDSE